MEVGSGPVPGRGLRAVDADAPREVAQRVHLAGVGDAHRSLVQTVALATIGLSLVGVTVGSIIGGSVRVAAVYGFVSLRPHRWGDPPRTQVSHPRRTVEP